MADPKKRYDRDGSVRLMAEADGYVMARRRGCSPFVLPIAQWNRLGASKAEGAAVEMHMRTIISARTTTECPDCNRRHAEIVLYPLRSAEACPVRATREAIEMSGLSATRTRAHEQAKQNCAAHVAKAACHG